MSSRIHGIPTSWFSDKLAYYHALLVLHYPVSVTIAAGDVNPRQPGWIKRRRSPASNTNVVESRRQAFFQYTVQRDDSAYATASSLFNRIPDVVAAPPGIQTLSQLGPMKHTALTGKTPYRKL
ncbi:MAG: hypothetical protein OXC05_05965 [Halieaceae bacterium]|nr:hypothetical protein [Halieaceae bacterium]